MKALVVTSRHRDYMALCLHDGLQEVLGEENVYDAVGCPSLHRSSMLEYLGGPQATAESARNFHTGFVCLAMGGAREGRVLTPADDGFDLLVMHSCLADDVGWEVAYAAANRLKPSGKVAWVDGADDARHVAAGYGSAHAYFRKEIDPSVSYVNAGYGAEPHHLNFAAPARWFDLWPDESRRDIDLFYLGNPTTNGADRWAMCSEVFRCQRRFKCIIGSCGLGFDHYFALLRRSKFALCPSGAASCDSMRTFEAVGCGAIPVFVGYPDFRRDPWFPSGTCVNCEVGTLAAHLDSALDGHDLTGMRAELRRHCLEHQTTRARALKVLTTLGFQEGKDW